MKRILTILAAIVCLCSCEETNFDGAWDPMELDKTHLNFTSEGGEQGIVVMNYSRVWIVGAYKEDSVDYIYSTSTGGDDAYADDFLDSDWYRVSIPNKGKSNTVIVSVDPNYTTKPRTAIIDLTSGDVFASISIHQN